MIKPYVPFSVRDRVSAAIGDPAAIVDRFKGGDWIEDETHWKARAAIEAVVQEAIRSPLFARYLTKDLPAQTTELVFGVPQITQQRSLNKSGPSAADLL